MARTDRSRIGAVLNVARRIAHDVEARTSISSLPPAPAPDLMHLYDALISDPALKLATRKLFKDGSYPEAVGKAYTVVNNSVKKRTKTARDGVDLMNHAFSEKAPVLAITARKTESQKNEHNGYRSIFTGVMQGIRNPHHHEHDLRDEADAALEMLVLANHLLRVANRAKKTRVKKATAP